MFVAPFRLGRHDRGTRTDHRPKSESVATSSSEVHGGFALVAALAHHQATGQGTHIDLSSIEAQSNLIGDSILAYTTASTVPSRTGND